MPSRVTLVHRLQVGTATLLLLASLGLLTLTTQVLKAEHAHALAGGDEYYVRTAVGGLLSLALVFFALMILRDAWRRQGRRETARPQATAALERLFRASDFLPDPMPHGWSVPLAFRGSEGWALEAGGESVVTKLSREGGIWGVHVTIAPRGRADPVSDDRCSEILRHLRGVGAFYETADHPEPAVARTWLAVPRGLRPKWKLPGGPPDPVEPELSPHLVAARKYLPEKLPKGWSVPIAITEDHGTEWKDGAWMMGTGHEVMLACLCTSKGRVKLAVTIFRPDGEEVSEGTALELLRQFRGVLEFVQTDTSDDPPPKRSTYLGELQPARGDRAMLN